jgi:hypothetical protein
LVQLERSAALQGTVHPLASSLVILESSGNVLESMKFRGPACRRQWVVGLTQKFKDNGLYGSASNEKWADRVGAY